MSRFGVFMRTNFLYDTKSKSTLPEDNQLRIISDHDNKSASDLLSATIIPSWWEGDVFDVDLDDYEGLNCDQYISERYKNIGKSNNFLLPDGDSYLSFKLGARRYHGPVGGNLVVKPTGDFSEVLFEQALFGFTGAFWFAGSYYCRQRSARITYFPNLKNAVEKLELIVN